MANPDFNKSPEQNTEHSVPIWTTVALLWVAGEGIHDIADGAIESNPTKSLIGVLEIVLAIAGFYSVKHPS